MIVSISKGFEYIPVWNENRKLPEAEQIKVRFEFISGDDMTKVLGRYGKKDYHERDFCAYVKSIENLQYQAEDGDIKDATPEDVFNEKGFAELYLELRGEFTKRSAIDKKK